MDSSEFIIFLWEIRVVFSPFYITFVYMEWHLLFFYTVTSFWHPTVVLHYDKSSFPNSHHQNDRIFSIDVCSYFQIFDYKCLKHYTWSLSIVRMDSLAFPSLIH